MQQSAPPASAVLKLPREVEVDPRREGIELLLKQSLKPLWERGTIPVAHVPFTPALSKALSSARRDSHLERGLDHIERLLRGEKKGLDALHEKQGTQPVHRVSRLLLMPDECGERFYRNCEALLFNHSDRLLGLRVAVSHAKLASELFGEDALVKALLISDRKAAASVLFSLTVS